jgi:cobalt-zinc-cadmium efflux system protein
MLAAAVPLLRRSGRILLEAAPEGLDPADVGAAMRGVECVVDVHDLHVWEITSGFPALSAHVLVRPGDDCHGIRRELELLVETRFGITHTTLQVEHAQPELLRIQPLRSDREDR